jgi:glycosyltransferase involved in cell wall biosynthesis
MNVREKPALSFVIRTYNDAAVLPQVLLGAVVAARTLGEPYDITVVDAGSSDETVSVALLHRVRVLETDGCGVAAARNLGARATRGHALVFLGPDIVVDPDVVRSLWRAVTTGLAGGSAVVRRTVVASPVARTHAIVSAAVQRAVARMDGEFLFCTRHAYAAVGGFDEWLGEGAVPAFCQSLWRMGRLTVLAAPVSKIGRAEGLAGVPIHPHQ